MRILAIETSCDETGASVIETKDNKIKILSNIIASSVKLHSQTGGIIPERAAREQVRFVIPVIIEALIKTYDKKDISEKEKFLFAQKILEKNIDLIAVTIGPGLIGSLLIGVETAKTLSFTLNKPVITVNHLLAHVYANFIDNKIEFPFVSLIVSGGHTDLLLFQDHNKYKWLGGTRDDAAGEAFDKTARLLGLGYPGGPNIEKSAKKVKKSSFKFTSPMLYSKDFDFSFSGLKTEVYREIKKVKKLNDKTINEICFALQNAISEVLVVKTVKAAEKFNVKTVLLAGGVSANESLRKKMDEETKKRDIKLFYPEFEYCTDNAAMVGAYAAFNQNPVPWQEISANPDLYFD